MYPESVRKLIDSFKMLPGIGSKSAERLAFCLVDFKKEKLTEFSDAICDVRDNICFCSVCGSITDSEICSICSSNERNKETILVVEKPKDIYLFERLGVYDGIYHVLGGLISPIDGVGPNDIGINSLLSRISNNNINEVILALKPSIEGETTMQYIFHVLKDKDVKVSKIATGVPMGTDMEYIDSLTLEMAIDERKNMS